jgi:UDP-N-acetylglucosamine 4,6-dehydratase
MEKFKGQTILITGGTGSFGNALIARLQNDDVHFVVYSRDEKKQHDMYLTLPGKNISYVIGDIRDKTKLVQSMRDVDYVFHAAALKQVPTGESFPEEVVYTNILGTKNVIDAADICGVKKLVALSTDKAVEPINAYGMSKALAEKIISAHQGRTPVVCLRYGNVLGSRGSVLPFFLDCIAQGKPLLITNPRMTRFLLTLDEAVSLALKCLSDGNNGDLFVMKSPACTIQTLVDALELHHKKETPKKIIGVRPGEKIHETLLTSDEVHRSVVERDGKLVFARIPPMKKGIGDFYSTGEEYSAPQPFTSENTEQYDAACVLRKIRETGLL